MQQCNSKDADWSKATKKKKNIHKERHTVMMTIQYCSPLGGKHKINI